MVTVQTLPNPQPLHRGGQTQRSDTGHTGSGTLIILAGVQELISWIILASPSKFGRLSGIKPYLNPRAKLCSTLMKRTAHRAL